MKQLFLVIACLVASPVLAQDFELDLSEEKPAKPLPEFRPTLAVLSVTAGDQEEVSASRARQLETEVLKFLAQGEDFRTIVEPSLVSKMLGAEAAKAQKCADWACYEWATKQLKAHRAVRITVTKAGSGSQVIVVGYDPAFGQLASVAQDSGEKAERSFAGMSGKTQAQKDRDFLKKIGPFLKGVLVKLATANGKISVDSPDPSAVAMVDGVEAGVGSFEVVAQRGLRTVKVAVAGFETFEEQVKVEPQKTAVVKVSLKAKALEVVAAPVVIEDTGTPIYKRPGLYVAVAGAIAVGVGIAMGQMAMSTQNAVNAGGDPVDVTRAEAKAAPNNAMLANILVGAGAAAIVGGTIWVILTPSKSSSAPPPGMEPGKEPGGMGATLSFGGTF